ncbi:MAG: hypothetical protein ACREIM_08330 [Nitrospiraceae bacterium]
MCPIRPFNFDVGFSQRTFAPDNRVIGIQAGITILHHPREIAGAASHGLACAKELELVTFDGGKPFLLTSANYSVVMAEENYRLRWFVNDVLFELEQSGQLGLSEAGGGRRPFLCP